VAILHVRVFAPKRLRQHDHGMGNDPLQCEAGGSVIVIEVHVGHARKRTPLEWYVSKQTIQEKTHGHTVIRQGLVQFPRLRKQVTVLVFQERLRGVGITAPHFLERFRRGPE